MSHVAICDIRFLFTSFSNDVTMNYDKKIVGIKKKKTLSEAIKTIIFAYKFL